MQRPLVSAILPIRNGQEHMRQAIDSVLAQTYPRVETVIVNDGSTDDTRRIIESYGDRVVAVHQENTGVAGARNAGISRSRGQFVAFLDCDDWWRPEKIEKQVAAMLDNDAVGLVHTGIDHYDQASGSYVGPLAPKAEPHRLVGNCYDLLLLDNQIYNSAVMVRRSVIDRVGMCDLTIPPNTVADYELWLRVARCSELAYLAEPLTVYRLHPEQGLWNRPKMLAAEAGVLEKIIAAEGFVLSEAMRRRMAQLYDALAVAHLDQGEPRQARLNFARSWKWKANGRAALGWTACLLPGGLISRVQARRNRRRKSWPGDADRAPSQR